MKQRYRLDSNPKASDKAVVQGKNYRFTILTGRLIRMEYSPNQFFEDRATKTIIHRDLPVPKYQVIDQKDNLEIITDWLHLKYDKGVFLSTGLMIRMTKNPYTHLSTWYYGDRGDKNLKGTASTLDWVDGYQYVDDKGEEFHRTVNESRHNFDLGLGLLSMNGFSVIDDTGSFVLTEDGFIEPGNKEHLDLYFFGYGRDYLDCLKDFFRISGQTPLLPRYMMGNWWSRFHRYSEQEYLDLMNRFDKEQIPFSVAILDMDWHLVDIDPAYGSGWTGYTWNKELFPEPKRLLDELHRQGRKVTLNVHPADGVRAFEEMYEPMARRMGIDEKSGVPIPFDITDPVFLDAYFECLHHPREKEGVDFWWVDWQQGNHTKIPGINPLWMLNHYHFLDSKKEGKRPVTFSRYAGLGSHRYPVGFSGDTIISWDSLDFQPYFTATASNVGYGWWSHDIGGHANGVRDGELAVRWLQFGVFSPIMRLHSSSSPFNGKEPWNYGIEEERVMGRFLRLRHQMIPYLYTMNYHFHKYGEPLIQPLYYHDPDHSQSYEFPNEYYFGSDLLVNPITTKNIGELKMGKVTAWIPQGRWYDIFTGISYQGNTRLTMYRTLETIPVLAKEGKIIPMQSQKTVSAVTKNPVDMEILVFTGAKGEFTLYEDDGISMDYESGQYAATTFIMDIGDDISFSIMPAKGTEALLPKERNYQVHFYGVRRNAEIRVSRNGTDEIFYEEYDKRKQVLTVYIGGVKPFDHLDIRLKNAERAHNQVKDEIFKILNRAQIAYNCKDQIFYAIEDTDSPAGMLSEIQASKAGEELKNALREIILADPGSIIVEKP